MLANLSKYVSTFCLTGKLPAAGTVASALTAAFYYFFLASFDTTFLTWIGAICSLMIFLAGWVTSSVHARNIAQEDPGEIVIDEVAGQFMALFLLQTLVLFSRGQLSGTSCFLCFCVFRILDITKPWPIGWLDLNVKGGLGIMLDDALAAFIASPIVFLIELT